MTRIVIKTSLESKRKALKAVEGIEGCYSRAFDLKNHTITVVGEADPVCLAACLRKFGYAEVLSVGPSKNRAAQFNFASPSHHTSLATSASTATSTSTSASTSASASASTSTATATGSYVFDVFISHRGPDTKKNFASHLYRNLIRHNYRVFLDNQEMQTGEKSMTQIEGAIQTASVHIAVFSPGYADSEWCLKELVLMLESSSQRRSTILPVFYNVQPSDLRRAGVQEEIYGRALNKLKEEKGFDLNTIDNWKIALNDVAHISGFELETCNRDEGLLVDMVVQRVLEIVPKPSLPKTSLPGAKFPTGLDDIVKDFENAMSLQQQIQETRVIGIAGLGGVGKTTLAKEIFNRRLSKYNKSCFLSNVRTTAIGSLQSRLIKDLVQSNKQIDDPVDFCLNKDERDILSSDPVLMVLDDVDNVKQLDALFEPVKNILQSGSLILITSRDKDVLKKADIESSTYTVTVLNPQHSLELFCWHAFRQRNPLDGFEQVVKGFLSLSSGLPLSLQVLGAYLYKEDLWNCEAKFRETSKAPHQDIQSCLKISYDGLKEEEKQIFLDIACFFIGEDKDTAIRIWEGFQWEGRLGLHRLENRCLVEVDTENRIRMHDHVRDLGRYMAEIEPGEGWRLWDDPNNRQLSDQSLVRGISMLGGDGRKWSQQSLEKLASSRLATNMSSLQLLRARGDSVQKIFTDGHSPQLLWLCWYDCSYSCLPHWIPLQNLTVLQVKGGKLRTLWPHESEAPLKLRELSIEGCPFEIPKSIGKLKDLQKFVLHSSVDMETLPDGFCDLRSLEHLELYNSNIKSLPHSFKKLTNLRCIRLSRCRELKMLPDSFGDLANLQHINLSNCSELKMLPDSFGKLANLQHINLSGCSTLHTLPEFFGSLRNLQHINLAWCSDLRTLPDSFAKLKNLQHIDLAGCKALRTLPDIFGNLTNLRHIDLSWCNVERPISLENLIQTKSQSD